MYLRYGEVEGIAAIGSNRSYKKHRLSQHADFHETRLSELYLGIKKNKSIYIYICIYFLFQLTTCNIHALFLCSFTDKETCQPAITIDTRRKRGFINAYVLLAMVTLSMLKFLFYIFLSLTGIKGIKIQRLGRDEFFANVYICHIVHIRSLNVVIFNGVVTVVKESRVFVARFRSWPS